MKEHFNIALRSMLSRKLRSWLTMIGIFIGIAGVVALVALGNGLQGAVQQEFTQLGLNRILIQPAGAAFGPLSGELSNVKLTEKDLEAIRKSAGVRYAAGLSARGTNVQFKKETKTANIFFHDTDSETLEAIDNSNLFDIQLGRELRKSDAQKIVVGYNVAHETFSRDLEIGDTLEILGAEFKIVGIQKKSGSPLHDGSIRMPTTSAKGLIDLEDKFTLITAITNPEADTEEVAENIKKELRNSRNVKEGDEDFSVQTPQQVLDTVFAIFGIVQTVVVAIASISLIVGAIGIMNTMYTSVLERTKDIGVMKAVGAKNRDITTIFLIESGILGFIGGIIGIALGLGVANLVALIARQMLASNLFQATVSTTFIIGMLAFAFLIGSLSGTLPAIQASKLKPVDALRYE